MKELPYLLNDYGVMAWVLRGADRPDEKRYTRTMGEGGLNRMDDFRSLVNFQGTNFGRTLGVDK